MRRAALIIGVLLTGTAFSASTDDVLKCTALEDGVKRLECYDALAKPLQAEADEKAALGLTTAPARDNWFVNISKSKIDDSRTVAIGTISKDDIPGRFNRAATPSLVLRCLENTTSAYINFDGLHMADIRNYGQVTFRVDKKTATTKRMEASTNSKALGFWRGGTAIPFIKSLFGGSSLIVQATPFSESPVIFSFDISGLEEAIQPLRESCGW